MKIDHQKYIRRYWGLLVLAGFMSVSGGIHVLEHCFCLSLRTVPRNILNWTRVGVAIVFFIWLSSLTRVKKRHSKSWRAKLFFQYAFPCIIATTISTLTIDSLYYSMMISRPEHVVEKNGEIMLARVYSFLDRYVYYYQYKGEIFYGKKLGFEYYGSGSGDPLEEKPIRSPSRKINY